MDAEPQGRRQLEGLAVDPGEHGPGSGPHLELRAGELPNQPGLTPPGQGQADDPGRLGPGPGPHGDHPEPPRVETGRCEASGDSQDVGVVRHHEEEGPVDLGPVGRGELEVEGVG